MSQPQKTVWLMVAQMSGFMGEIEVLNRTCLCRKEKLYRFRFNLGLGGGIFLVGFLFAKLVASLE